MSASRALLLATFILGCAFLLACSTPPQPATNGNQPTPEASLVSVPTPTNIANGLQTSGERYEGFLDQADCNSVWGWAWNKSQKKPNQALYVEILSDNVPISTVPASQPRWSIVSHTGDDGYHGFVYTVHESLKDGRPHVITARIAQTDSELQNGPKIIRCSK